MATPTIGTFQFSGWPDTIVLPSIDFRQIDRPAVDGSAVVWDAKRAKPQTVRTSAITADLAAAQALLTSYRGIRKTSVSVTTPTGQTLTNVLILDVQGDPAAYLTGGATAAGILNARWTILLDATASES